ncbi:MAG: hypothetical protein GY940_26210 [bacterium]|nr:hypothetical protein [bacterium]
MTEHKQSKFKKIFWAGATPQQAKDTGMAAVLILLIITLITKNLLYIKIALPILFLTMAAPTLFTPLAKLWFGLAHIMGNIVSKIILTIIFFLIVTPMALIRKLLGKNPLQLKEWKNNTQSIMKTRNHKFQKEDLEKPY